MKKTFSLEIKSPCEASLEAMDKIDAGFYCHLCTKEVIDFSNKSDYEIANFIKNAKNQTICANLKSSQLEKNYEFFEHSKSNHNLKYAVAVAASVLLTANVSAQEKQTQETVQCDKNSENLRGKIAVNHIKSEKISFVIKGKILDKKTKKPLTDKQFQKMEVYVTNSENQIQVNSKTGGFTAPINLENGEKELNISFYAGQNYLEKIIPFKTSSIKNNVLTVIIYADPKEFKENIRTAGLISVKEEIKPTK